jgi:hypothetical protein
VLKILTRFFCGLFYRPEPTVLRYGVTIHRFKADPARVRAIHSLYNSKPFQLAMAVVATASPPHGPCKDGNDALFQMGVAKGIKDTFAMLKFLGEPDAPTQDNLTPDWGVPDDEDQTAQAPDPIQT